MTKTEKSVEKNLQKILDKYRLSKQLTVAMIKGWILNDEGESAMDASNRFQKKCFSYFTNVKDIDELNKILQVFVNAWNYFPHKSLEGKSPNRVVQEALAKNPDLRKRRDHQRMPDIIVGGRKMVWDEYWAMLKEMERLQTPFRKFVEDNLLPRYGIFLRESFGEKAVKKHLEVAEIFFERAMRVGFIELKEIRKDFIQKEFPKWWQTHVLTSNLSEKEVLSSLNRLFQFLASAYDIDIKIFGF